MLTGATSFVLRFRDLVTGTNETIGRHETIADAEGYVWWGWWKKSGERPAVHEFARLLKNKPLSILLLDSGQGCVYRATCEDVRANVGSAIASPEASKTPAYYRDQKYYTWFRLYGFERVEDEAIEQVLRGLTYVEVNEFFEDDASPFKTFYGKRIYGSREMIQQNRTVWFTRITAPADPCHEIELLNAEHVAPRHFTQSYFSTSSRQFLWVSDLHFAKDRRHHGFPAQPDEQEANLWLALENALKQLGLESLAGVLASGDISWRADPSEFDDARTAFFERLMSSYRLDPRQIGLCPGNHDIAFSDKPAEKHVPVTRAAAESEAAYRSFYETLFRLSPNSFLSCGRRLLIGAALPIDVICLNSSLLQQHPDFKLKQNESSPVFQGQGFVGAAQLDDAAKQFKWDSETFSHIRALRVVVLHHHVLPVTEAERAIAGGNYSMVLDAERLCRWLVRHRVDLVLHGHQHQPYSAAITRSELLNSPETEHHTFRVLGMGSTGVANEHLGSIKRNTFGILEFTKDSIRVNYYSIHPSNRTELLFNVRVPYAYPRTLLP